MKDKRLVRYRIFLWVALLMTIFSMFVVYRFYVVNAVPDRILLRKGKEEKVDFAVPVSAHVYVEGNSTKATENEIPVTSSVSITAGDAKGYTMDLKYLGIIPLKTVTLDIVSDKQVAISGSPIGIYLKTWGVMVIDTGSYKTPDGEEISPSQEILQPGDYILEVAGTKVEGKKHFVDMVEQSGGEELILTILRNEEESDVKIRPQQNEEGVYKLGIWVRDSAQGIGTLSYITKDGDFAALGHGINDSDVGCLMDVKRGSIYETSILAIRRGDVSEPGELTGVLSFEQSDYMGKIEENTSRGIFGSLSEEFLTGKEGTDFLKDCREYPAALKQEVKCGPAQIYCEIKGEPTYYDITIDELWYDPEEVNRGIMLTITDEELLQMTGGIVQGMSGSPILQNGKIVGVITHVLVNDPTRGYGIFIEEMLEH